MFTETPLKITTMNAPVPAEILAPSWHVVQSKPRMEQRAKENLENQGFEVFLPMLDIQKVRRGKLQTITEPLFSRYMFLRLTEQMQDLSVVRSSKGVSHLVRFGTTPTKPPSNTLPAMAREGKAGAVTVKRSTYCPLQEMLSAE